MDYDKNFPPLSTQTTADAMPEAMSVAMPVAMPVAMSGTKPKSRIFLMFLSWFFQPFKYINASTRGKNDYSVYKLSSIFRPLFGQTASLKDAGTFPNNIKYFIWCQKGINDEKPWLLLCRLTNGKYAYFSASCDYTGFSCQGGMSLYISDTIEVLVDMAMSTREREKYYSFLEKKHRRSTDGRHKLTLRDFCKNNLFK